MDYTVIWSSCGELSQEGKELREEVFMGEQRFPYDIDACDDISYHITMLVGKFCAAAGRIYPTHDGAFRLGRIVVKLDYRGLGLGKALMDELCKKAQEMGGSRVILGSQLRAQGFYEACGFTPYGEVFLEDGVEHIMMEKSL